MNIYAVFREKLEKNDPPHALMLNGIVSASNWIMTLGEHDLLRLVSEISKNIKTMTEREKLEIIFVAEKTNKNEFLSIVSEINKGGESAHGAKVALYAEQLMSNRQT